MFTVLDTVTIELIGKPGCHLCDDAREVVQRVIEEYLGAGTSLSVELIELNILQDAELAQRFAEEIPVVRINGKIHNYWRIDPKRLSEALDDLARHES